MIKKEEEGNINGSSYQIPKHFCQILKKVCNSYLRPQCQRFCGLCNRNCGHIIICNFITISRIVMKLQTRLQFKALIPLNRPSAICLMFVLNKLLCQRTLITCNNQQMQIFCSMKLKPSNQIVKIVQWM